MAIPITLLDRLRIVPVDEPVKKKVTFSDLNAIRTYRLNEPPALLNEHNQVERLKAHIRLLESQLDSYESSPPSSVKSFASTVCEPRTPSQMPSVRASSVQSMPRSVQSLPRSVQSYPSSVQSVPRSVQSIPAPIPQRVIVNRPVVSKKANHKTGYKFFKKLSVICFMSIIPMIGVAAAIPPIGGGLIAGAAIIGLFSYLMSQGLK